MKAYLQWIKNHKRLLAAFLFWSLTAALMIFIFYMSAQTSAQSSEISGGLIEEIAHIINKNYPNLDDVAKVAFIESLQDIVRTLAHFCEFSLLGFLGFYSMYFTLIGKKILLWSTFMGWIYSLSDEIHQLFVPGRAFQIKDILVDWSGVLLGAALAFILWKFIEWLMAKKTLSK